MANHQSTSQNDDCQPEAPLKECRKCGKTYPHTSEFFIACKRYKSGLRARCKACINPQNRRGGLRFRRARRLEVLSHYSQGVPQCVCCGESTFEFLALDHLEGSSQEDYKAHGDGFFSWLKRNNYPRKMQVLCHNCNAVKSIHGHCCVHKPHLSGPQQPVRKGRPIIPMPAVTDEELDNASGVLQECASCHNNFPCSSRYFHKHPATRSGLRSKCRDCSRGDYLSSTRKRHMAARNTVLDHYSNGNPACAICGITDRPFLTIDHVNGGGLEHKRRENFKSLHMWLVQNNLPEGFRILCYNHNLSLGFYGQTATPTQIG